VSRTKYRLYMYTHNRTKQDWNQPPQNMLVPKNLWALFWLLVFTAQNNPHKVWKLSPKWCREDNHQIPKSRVSVNQERYYVANNSEFGQICNWNSNWTRLNFVNIYELFIIQCLIWPVNQQHTLARTCILHIRGLHWKKKNLYQYLRGACNCAEKSQYLQKLGHSYCQSSQKLTK